MRFVRLWAVGGRSPAYVVHRRFAVLLAREPLRAQLSSGLDDLFCGRPSAVEATAEHEGLLVDAPSLAHELIGSCRPAGVVLTREDVMGAVGRSGAAPLPTGPDSCVQVGANSLEDPGAGRVEPVSPVGRGQSLRTAARAREAAVLANIGLRRCREAVEQSTETVRRLEAEVRGMSAQFNTAGSTGSGRAAGSLTRPDDMTAHEPLTPDRRSAIEQAHNDVVRAAEYADHRAFHRLTRRRLERAREAESRLLGSHGFVSFADYVIAGAEGTARLAKAESQLRGARAAAFSAIAELRTCEARVQRAVTASAAAEERRAQEEGGAGSPTEGLALDQKQPADTHDGDEFDRTAGLGSVIRSLLFLGDPVPGVPRPPVVVDDAFALLPDEMVWGLLDLLEREAEGMQILYLTDDRRVLKWADAAGPDRAGVCLPLRRWGRGRTEPSATVQPLAQLT